MSLSALLLFTRDILSHVPWFHWILMGAVSLALTTILLIRKKYSVYAAFVLGVAVFIGLLLLDTTVFIRYFGFLRHRSGLNLGFALHRLLYGSNMAKGEVISNLAVFVPFGIFLSEFLSTTKRISTCRQIGFTTLVAFGLSLSIEGLQLALQVGYFELTDLILNTVGSLLGTSLALLARWFFGCARVKRHLARFYA